MEQQLLESGIDKHQKKHAASLWPFKWMSWNTPVNLTLYALAIFCSTYYARCDSQSNWFVAVAIGVIIYLGELLLCDVLYYGFGIDAISPSETMSHQYNMSLAVDGGSAMLPGMDYGFNFYDGDFEKPPQQAQEDKFKYAYDQLGLKPGMRLLDCGCGCGDWILWLQQRGIHVVGINMAQDQVKVCWSRGLDVVLTDWKNIEGNTEFEEKLYGKFDAMSFWDTVEHYVPMKWGMDRDKCKEVWTNMFRMAKRMLDPTSPCKKVWISCLHICKDGSMYNSNMKYVLAYFMDKVHSGMYPLEGELQECAATQEFSNIHDKDCTLDYYMTSILCPEHFGRHKQEPSFKFYSVLFWNCFADPCWIHKLIWLNWSVWMKQFDGQNINNSMIKLHWLIFDANRAFCEAPTQTDGPAGSSNQILDCRLS